MVTGLKRAISARLILTKLPELTWEDIILMQILESGLDFVKVFRIGHAEPLGFCDFDRDLVVLGLNHLVEEVGDGDFFVRGCGFDKRFKVGEDLPGEREEIH